MLWALLLFANTQKKDSQCKTPKVAMKKDANKWAFLDKTFRGVLTTNGKIKANQAGVRAAFEKYPQAVAGFLPQITTRSNLDFSNTKTTEGPGSYRNWVGSMRSSVNLDQNIFNGFFDKANMNQAKETVGAAIWDYFDFLSQTFMEVVQNVEEAKYQWANIDASKTSLKVKAKVWEIARIQHKTETIPLFQLKTAESEHRRVEAKRFSEEAELEKQKAIYFENTGHEIFYTDGLPMPEDLPKTYEQAEKIMLVGNYGIKSAQIKLTISEREKEKATAAFLPKVGLGASLEYGRNFDQGAQPTKGGPNVLSEPTKQISKRIGITVTNNVFNGGADLAKRREAIQNIAKARQELQFTMQKKRAELKAAWAQYQNALQSQQALKRALVGFQAAYNGIFGQYKEGAKGVRDVLDEEEKLDNAKRELANNEKVLRISAWQLTMLLGKLNPEALGLTVQTFKPLEEFKAYAS